MNNVIIWAVIYGDAIILGGEWQCMSVGDDVSV